MSEAAISTQELKTQMKSLKLELKSWEHDFLKEKGRKPQKDDILQDRAIAKKYKQYGKLKQQAAERSLNEGGDFGSDDDLTRTNGRKSMNRGRGETNGEPLEFGKSLGQDKSKFVSSHLDEAVRGETSPVGQYEGFEVRDLDKPTEPVEILQNPNLAFRSNHPLLKNLSFIPAEPIPAPEEVQVQKLNLPEPRLSQVRQKRLTITNEVVKTYDNPLKQCHPVSDPQLFKRVALGDVLRCKIIRKNAGLDSLYPTFYLLNEADEKFLLAARKRKKAKNSHYIVSSDIDNLTKESKGYVAKIKADSSNLSFTVYDARSYAPAQPHKGLRDMCAIAYDKSSMPRDIKAAIRPPSMPDDSKEPFTRNILEDLIIDSSKVSVMKSAKPKFDRESKTYGLNFGGRVKVASIKNFQLVDPIHQNSLILQFGRTSEDSFALDAFYPLTPVEAFSIALTVFEAYEK